MPLSIEREIYVPSNNDIIARRTFHPLDHVDLSFPGVETQHSTHGIHPYVAAINPPLVSTLLENFAPHNGNILDPYCGGGGVLVESILNGYNASGNDINPLAVCISKAKTQYIPKNDIEKCYKNLLLACNETIIKQDEIDCLPDNIKYWFMDSSLISLLKIKKAMMNLKHCLSDSDYKSELHNLFNVIFSATIRDVMLTYRGEVRLRKLRGVDLERFNPDVFTAFQKRTKLAADRVSSLPPDSCVNVSLMDSRKTQYKNKEFTTIICSPPYGDDKNGVGYFQFSSKMLFFLGYEDMTNYRKMFLGGTKDNKRIPPSNSLKQSLENVYHHNTTHYNEAVAFYSDYYEALKEMSRVTSDRIIIVIGNRVLSRTSFNNAKITVEMFENMGIDLELYFQRSLPKKRIANLGGDGGGGNIEHILVFHI